MASVRKVNREMKRTKSPQRLAWSLAAASATILSLSSCTTTSNLSAQAASSNIEAVNRIASESPGENVATSEESAPADSDAIVGAPRPEIVDEPARERAAYTLSSVPLTSVKHRPTNQIMMVRTTAYSHLQADSLPYGRKSAAGTTLRYGNQVRSAAADWSKYPLGTRFKIEGLPYVYVVDDYGSALCGTETIDIYKPNLAGIGDWGVRNVPVRVIEWGSFEESRRILDSRKHVKHAHHVRTMLREIEKMERTGYHYGPANNEA